MVDKQIALSLLKKNVAADLDNGFYYRGLLEAVGDTSVLILLRDGKRVAIELESICFLREVD